METQFHSQVPGGMADWNGGHRVSTGSWAHNQLVLFLFIEAWLVFLHLRLSLHPVPGVRVLGQAFDLTRESSLPTFWTCLLTLGVGIGSFLVSYFLRRQGAPARRALAWLFAGAVFTVFAVDDAIAFHEKAGSITSLRWVESLGYPSHPWHITVGPVFALGLLLAGFVIGRDIRTRKRWTVAFLLAFSCLAAAFALDYREGVVQMESVNIREPAPGSEAVPALMLLEEALEMAGMTLLLYVVLGFLTCLVGEVEFRRQVSAPERPSLPLQAVTPPVSAGNSSLAPAAGD